MAPKTSTKPASKAPVKEEVKAEPAAAAVTVVGAVGPNAGKTVQGMSFLSMLKKNPVAAEAPKEEEKPKPAPVAVDLPVAAAAPAKAKKGKKEAPAAAPVAAVEEPAVVVVEEPVAAAAPVVAEPEPVVEPVVPEPEPVKAEEVVAAPQEVVVESTPAPAPFNWADAGSDFTQFSSRTEILAAQPEQVVEKLTPPGPLVTFRTPFAALSNLVFVAPSHTAMLLANRLTSIQQREEQLLLREKTLETQAAAEKARMAKNDKEIADLKQRLSAERDQLNRERTEFRTQQEKQQLQQQQQQQQQQPHHHQPPHPHHPHTVFPSHSSHADVGRPSTSWADEDYGYDAPPVQYGQSRPAPQHYGRPNAPMPSHPRQMGTGYPSAYNQTRAPPMNRGAPPMGSTRPIYPQMQHHVHHHHQSHHQPHHQFGGHQYEQQQQW